jgi:hypothetical protein
MPLAAGETRRLGIQCSGRATRGRGEPRSHGAVLAVVRWDGFTALLGLWGGSKMSPVQSWYKKHVEENRHGGQRSRQQDPCAVGVGPATPIPLLLVLLPTIVN